MPESRTQGGDLFIVDNFDPHWKVRTYLNEWCDIASAFGAVRPDRPSTGTPPARGMFP